MEKKNLDKNIVLTEWQTCVQMADSVSKRRDTTNNLFVTLNLALLAASQWNHSTKSVFVIVLGVILCILWGIFIWNYRCLNQAKFSVISVLEKSLPVAPFDEEWRYIKGKTKYKEGTALEMFLPAIFAIGYLIIAGLIYYGGITL